MPDYKFTFRGPVMSDPAGLAVGEVKKFKHESRQKCRQYKFTAAIIVSGDYVSCSIEAPTSEALVVGSDATITQVRSDTQIRGASGAEVAFVPPTLIGPDFGPSCRACIFFLPDGSTSAIGTGTDENRELKDYFPFSLGALKL